MASVQMWMNNAGLLLCYASAMLCISVGQPHQTMQENTNGLDFDRMQGSKEAVAARRSLDIGAPPQLQFDKDGRIIQDPADERLPASPCPACDYFNSVESFGFRSVCPSSLQLGSACLCLTSGSNTGGSVGAHC